MKKKTSLLFIIPAAAVMVAVGVAAAIKLLSPESAVPAKAKTVTQYPNPFANPKVEKPSSFLGSLLKVEKATTSSNPAAAVSADNLSAQLGQTVDDGGASEFQSLTDQIEGL